MKEQEENRLMSCCDRCVFWDYTKSRCREWYELKIPNDPFHKCNETWGEFEEERKPYKEEVLNKALELFIQWAVECGFGYDNLGDLLEKYEFVIEDYGYTEGLKYIAIEEALTALGVRGEE